MQIKIAKTVDLEPDSCMTVTANSEEIALYRVGDAYYASTNTCPHRGGPLGEGLLEDKTITCPWHGWQFDVCKGVSLVNDQVKLKTFPVTVQGDDICIEM